MDEVEVPASRLRTGTGEHLARLKHRGVDGHAVLTLAPDSFPRGDVEGWRLPASAVERVDGGSFRVGFPQYEQVDVLEGHLRNGLPIALLDVHLSFWILDRAHLVCDTALVGFGLDQAVDRAFERLRFQVSGLGSTLGLASIHVPMPGPPNDSGTTEARVLVNNDSTLTWSEAGVVCEAGLSQSFNGLGDAFHYEITSQPFVQLTADEPISWGTWLDDWVQPVQHLVALAARKPNEITSASLQTRNTDPNRPEDVEHWSTAQVFGHGIRQAPYEVRGRWDAPPLFSLARAPVSLPELVSRWRALQRDHPGFIDTYLPVLHEAPMPDAARFLFLTSAVEALHSSLHGESPRSQRSHQAEQKRLLDKVREAGALADDELASLKGHLSRTNFFSLPERLKALTDALPRTFVRAARLRPLSGRVPRLRNRIAHGRDLSAADRAEVDVFNEALLNLIDASLMRLLGLPLDGLQARIDSGR